MVLEDNFRGPDPHLRIYQHDINASINSPQIKSEQVRQQHANSPYGGARVGVGGGGAVKTICNTVAPVSNGLHIFLLIMDSSVGCCPVTYIFRKLSSTS